MTITNVRMHRVENGGKLKAVASITLSEIFVVHDIKIIETGSGLIVAMPSRKLEDGTFRDIVHPINAETRKVLEETILEKYRGI